MRSQSKPRRGVKSDARHGGRGQLRIIAGEWRGRKLPVADIEGLRPTSDRVRETVFNWLSPYIPGARVLDCFSGTGALSLEALSRGASEVVMLEQAAAAANVLKSNLATLASNKAQVFNTDSLDWLTQAASNSFDIIFLDPPFRKGLLAKVCELLQRHGYINDQTIIYIEMEKEFQLTDLPPAWQQLKEKVAGQVRYGLWTLD